MPVWEMYEPYPTARFSPLRTLTLSLISLRVHLGTNAMWKCSRLSIKMHDSACGGDPWQNMELRKIPVENVS